MAAMLFAYAAFFSFAYRDLTAATGALLLFGAVQLTMMGYGLWTGERIGGLRLVGLLLALAGLVWLLLPGLAAPPPLARGADAGARARPGASIRCSARAPAIRRRRPAAISCAPCPLPRPCPDRSTAIGQRHGRPYRARSMPCCRAP